MIRYLRKGALAFALLGMGFWSVRAAAAPNAPAQEEYKPDQVIIMKEQGKPDRRCVVLSVMKQPDGTSTYQLKALDGGEIMTIHTRVPANTSNSASAKPVETNAQPSNPNAMSGIALPADVANKSDADLPRAKPRPIDPLLNPTIPESGKHPALTSKPGPSPTPTATPAKEPTVPAKSKPETERQRFRLFGKTEPAAPCNTCAPKQQPATTAKTTVPHATQEPPLVSVANDPIPLAHGPQVSTTAAAPPQSLVNEPAPTSLYQAPLDPGQQAIALENERIEELKDSLKNSLRPTHRMAAADALCTPSRITDVDTRAVVMLAAQDDPAGVVRAACIRGMSRTGLRDQAYMALLLASQNDRDPIVREEAGFAMRKATKR